MLIFAELVFPYLAFLLFVKSQYEFNIPELLNTRVRVECTLGSVSGELGPNLDSITKWLYDLGHH